MMKKPTYKQLENALRALVESVDVGLFNAVSRREINDQPSWRAIERRSNHAEKLLRAIRANDQAHPTAADGNGGAGGKESNGK